MKFNFSKSLLKRATFLLITDAMVWMFIVHEIGVLGFDAYSGPIGYRTLLVSSLFLVGFVEMCAICFLSENSERLIYISLINIIGIGIFTLIIYDNYIEFKDIRDWIVFCGGFFTVAFVVVASRYILAP